MIRRSIARPLLPLVLVMAMGTVPVSGMHEEEGDPTARLIADQAPAADGEAASEEDRERRHVVRHKIVFLGEDGEAEEIEGEGDAFGWIAADSPHRRFRIHMPGIALREGGFLGITTTSMTPQLRRHFGAPEDAGVMISTVVDDAPAFTAGLRVGDILTAVDGEPIRDQADLLHEIRRREEGDTVSLDIVRDGMAQQIVAVLAKRASPGGHSFAWNYRFDCDGDAECSGIDLELCADGDDCRIEVRCDGEICFCEVEGEEVECRGLDDLPRNDD